MLQRVLTAIQFDRRVQFWIALLCIIVIAPVSSSLPAQETAPAKAPAPEKLPPERLDSLVAPIALYPDPMLSQTLVASTYPLELVQLQQWLAKNPTLKDKALADAVAKQGWDASIQAMAALPDVVKRMAENIQWTTDLGNAFLSQQADVMEAVQRMRKKAQDGGNLKTGKEQKVETKVVEQKQVIVIEQANPQVVYVPSYNPTVVYGPPAYPYPPIYYPPPPPPGYYAAGVAISFGVGVAMGAMWSGGWGWHCGWGHNDIDINVNNNFNRNTNINRGNTNIGNSVGNKWQHNPQHRGGAPYADRATANKYGGSARGDSLDQRRQVAERQQSGRAATTDRAGASGGRASTMDSRGSAADRSGGVSDRASGGRDTSSRGAAGVSDRSSGGLSGGGDRVGSRQTSPGGSGGAFGGSGGYSGGSARASSQRGASSMGSARGGGGASRGGGGRRR